MAWPLAIAVFFTIWWVALFAVLPHAARRQSDQRPEDWPEGADPGAPSRLRLWRVVLWTTIVAAVVFAVVDAAATSLD